VDSRFSEQARIRSYHLSAGPLSTYKSLALRELENWCCNIDEEKKVISDIEVPFPSSVDDAIDLVNAHKTIPPEGQTQPLTEK